jgi:lysozyme
MDLSKLYAPLEREEGRRHAAYRDSLGILTIGVGFNIDGEHGGGLDDDEINFILSRRVNRAATAAHLYPWFDNLDEPRQLVVVDMIYNMGPAIFAMFKATHAAIAARDYARAALQMKNSRWHSQVGDRAAKLERIMETGIWDC